MTRHDLLDLVEDATRDLPWDADRVIAAATTTGRIRLRRRRAGTALVTCAVLGFGATGWVAATQGGEVTRGVDPATQRTDSPSPTPSPTPSAAAADTRWRLAVTSAQVPATFASILPGQITTLPQKETDDAAPIVDFRWNGYAVRVALTSTASQDQVMGPRVRCLQGSSGQPCTPGQATGSYESSMTWTGPAVDGAVTTREVRVSFAEGWDVLVTVADAADSKGAALPSSQSPDVPDVPLTLDQLRQVAYSPAWFEQ